MRLEITRDVAIVDHILTDDSVFPFISVDGVSREGFSAADLVQAEGNITFLAFDEAKIAGCVIAVRKDATTYELHTNFLETFRDSFAFEAARGIMRCLFMETPCLRLTSFCFDDCPGPLLFAKKNGFRVDFTRKGYVKRNGADTDCHFVSLDLTRWFFRNAEQFEEIGKRFHDSLEHQLGHENHPEDPIHNNVVGAAIVMMGNGLEDKAERFFNDLAGYLIHDQCRYLGRRGDWFCLYINTFIIMVNRNTDVEVIGELKCQ